MCVARLSLTQCQVRACECDGVLFKDTGFLARALERRADALKHASCGWEAGRHQPNVLVRSPIDPSVSVRLTQHRAVRCAAAVYVKARSPIGS